MNRKVRGLFYTIPGLVLGVVGASSCDKVAKAIPGPEDLCGPCGTIATGDFSVSGDARLDGFFQAVGTLNNAANAIKADFDANITALAGLYNIDVSGGIDATVVGKLTQAIDAEVTASATGGIKIDYQPPQCSANISVAVDAQAKCEAKAGCDVQANPGSVSVECKGECSGGCDAECTGSATCVAKAPSVTCSGKCEGSCQLDAAAKCEGTCHGTCDGKCDGTCSGGTQDANGKCSGTCDGKCDTTCKGSCELSAAATCSGKCTGTCAVDSGGAKCDANAECHGSCSGKCSGGCTGEATPPSASASCDASADCQASAKAQGSASLDCTPPQLAISYNINASVSADAQATFVAHMGEVKARGAAIVQGASRLKLLIQGDASLGIPSPLEGIKASLSGFASADAIGKFDIPAGRLVCVVPAFVEAGKDIAAVATNVGGTITAQAKFVAYITTGKP
ncbi:MAG TPA: hypothetical protein VHE30_09620 [Polyangiaceae bacterium]|nr:hypothetical protein [Polyangiaceae bacterium]